MKLLRHIDDSSCISLVNTPCNWHGFHRELSLSQRGHWCSGRHPPGVPGPLAVRTDRRARAFPFRPRQGGLRLFAGDIPHRRRTSLAILTRTHRHGRTPTSPTRLFVVISPPLVISSEARNLSKARNLSARRNPPRPQPHNQRHTKKNPTPNYRLSTYSPSGLKKLHISRNYRYLFTAHSIAVCYIWREMLEGVCDVMAKFLEQAPDPFNK